jgi:hypothetical protein
MKMTYIILCWDGNKWELKKRDKNLLWQRSGVITLLVDYACMTSNVHSQNMYSSLRFGSYAKDG